VAEHKATKDPKGMMLKILVVLVTAWLLVWALPFISLKFFSPVDKDYHDRLVDILGQWSAFGDLFNAFSALLTATALLGVIYTAILQRQQITMQMQELEETRKQTKIAEEAAQLARDERDEYAKEVRERHIVRLRETILSAKTAIAKASSQLATGNLTGGKREEREQVAMTWLRKIEESLQADEDALAEAMRR
jgi:hypothetical protein